jgi:thioredoxin reductase (NADPH)
MKEYNFDAIILGGGPAGLSAGIYLGRSCIKTAIIDTSILGGQPSNYLEIENYPGFSSICGYELMEKFEAQLDKYGIEKFTMQEIKSVELNSRQKRILTSDGCFNSQGVIIACGSKCKKLGIKGELEFLSKGVSYCAVCDGAFFQDKVLAVIGGGNSALEEADYLTRFSKKVYLIHRRDFFRADKIVQEKTLNNPKIEVLFNTIPLEILGKDNVEALKLKNNKTGLISELSLDGVFPYIGYSPNVECLSCQLEQEENGFIITDSTMKTSIDGVYAVGDVRNTPLRQVVTATSDGAISAVYLGKYLESLRCA